MNVWSTDPIELDGKWFVNVIDSDNAEVVAQKGPYISRAQAMEAIDKNRKEQLKQLENEKNEKTNVETDMLESMFNNEQMRKEFERDGLIPRTPEELKEELLKFEDKFDKEELECKEEAKGLLIGIASLYLKGKLINDSDYLRFRLKIEQEGFASVIFQLKTSRRAIHKISQEIHMGNFSPRMIEVMTQLQRVVLDITKFQHQYMISLETSFKNLAVDNDVIPSGSSDPNNPTQEGTVEISNNNAIVTNNRKKLLENLNMMLSEAKIIKTPKSKNAQLDDPNDDSLVEFEEVERKDEKDDEEYQGKTGLETFDGEDD